MKIKHVKGNVLRVAIPLTIKRKKLENREVTETVEDFYPCSDYPTYINFKKSLTIPFEASVQDNIARMQDDGTLNVGTYQIEVLCYDEAGEPYRYMVRDVVEVVDATVDADIEAGIEFDSEDYTLDGAVFESYEIEEEILTELTTPLKVGKYYHLDAAIEDITFTLPSIASEQYAKKVSVFFTTSENPTINITAADGREIVYQSIEIEPNTIYKMTATFIGRNWIVDYSTFGTTEQ